MIILEICFMGQMAVQFWLLFRIGDMKIKEHSREDTQKFKEKLEERDLKFLQSAIDNFMCRRGK